MRQPLLHTLLIILAAALLLAAACGETRLPRQLVEADSAMMHGRYRAADSLIAACASSDEALAGEPARMYLRLLRLGMKEKHMQPMEDDLLPADTLRRYYERHGPRRLYALSLFYSGCAWRDLRDHPSALDCFLRAAAEARQAGDLRLLSWIYKQKGDLYFNQAAYDDCLDDYRRYFETARNNLDTLQSSLAANRMGYVYTIKNKVDSALICYKQSCELSSHTECAQQIAPYSKERIADLYIQIEEYDSAAMFMERTPPFYAQWGYLNLANSRLDSAAYYFRMSMNATHSIHHKIAMSREILDIALQRQHSPEISSAVSRYQALLDTARISDSRMSILREESKFRYNRLSNERDMLARKSSLYGWLCILLLLLFLFLYLLQKIRHLQAFAKTRQRKLLDAIKSQQKEESIKQLEENGQKEAMLKSQLDKAKAEDDKVQVAHLLLELESLHVENAAIRIRHRKRSYLIKEMEKSELYIKIKSHSGSNDFHLTDEEWLGLAHELDAAYCGFTRRILSVSDFKEHELRLIYLVKIGLPPADIARILNMSSSNVSLMRKRLHARITGQKNGSAQEFDEFIRNF